MDHPPTPRRGPMTSYYLFPLLLPAPPGCLPSPRRTRFPLVSRFSTFSSCNPTLPYHRVQEHPCSSPLTRVLFSPRRRHVSFFLLTAPEHADPTAAVNGVPTFPTTIPSVSLFLGVLDFCYQTAGFCCALIPRKACPFFRVARLRIRYSALTRDDTCAVHRLCV